MSKINIYYGKNIKTIETDASILNKTYSTNIGDVVYTEGQRVLNLAISVSNGTLLIFLL